MTSRVISKPGSMGRVAMVAAGALLLGGCAGGAPGPASSSETTQSAAASVFSPSPTPTPTVAPYKPASAAGPAQNVPLPVLPAVAKTETKEGLVAFTRYWFELLNYAYQTGDVVAVAQVTSPECEYCSKITDSLKTNYEGERWLVGGKLTVPVTNTNFRKQADGTYQVELQVLQAPIKYYNTGGSQFRNESKSSNTGNLLRITFRESAWYVHDLHPIR